MGRVGGGVGSDGTGGGCRGGVGWGGRGECCRTVKSAVSCLAPALLESGNYISHNSSHNSLTASSGKPAVRGALRDSS